MFARSRGGPPQSSTNGLSTTSLLHMFSLRDFISSGLRFILFLLAFLPCYCTALRLPFRCGDGVFGCCELVAVACTHRKGGFATATLLTGVDCARDGLSMFFYGVLSPLQPNPASAFFFVLVSFIGWGIEL